jgi:hypothetical protein
MNRWRVVTALALAGWTVSCGDPFGSDQDQLAMAEARWAAVGPASYDFDVSVSCFCIATSFGTVTVSVRNHQVVSVVRSDSGTAVDSAFFRSVLTVDRMFATVLGFLDRKPASFRATYDPSQGYPTMLSVDPATNTADDEFSFTVSGLRAFLPP